MDTMADRVLVMDQGRLVADGAPSDAALRAALVAVFGGAFSVEGLNTPSGPRWVALPATVSVERRKARPALPLARSIATIMATPRATPTMKSALCQRRRAMWRRLTRTRERWRFSTKTPLTSHPSLLTLLYHLPVDDAKDVIGLAGHFH